MYLGLDLGTSGVKAVLLGETGTVLAQATAPLTLMRPHPGWSEQDPENWWRAASQAIGALRHQYDLTGVRALGLCGQMHGAVVLDAADRVLRPAILWNDGRSHAECDELEQAEPRSRTITGNRAMPGFTAPKLLWLRRHEPALFARIRRVLLPKDWLRLRLSGDALSDMSDASGTLWLDVASRRWSPDMLAASGLTETEMPQLAEGSAIAGCLRAEVATEWGLPAGSPIAAGAGDNAAGAVGIGCIEPGQAFVSLGTSGVIFVADGGFQPDPDRTVHAFCHCLPGRWHRMSVILSAAAALAWITRVSGAPSEAALLSEVAAASVRRDDRLVFLPYLAGERTPHNDPAATGVFFGLTGGHERADLARAVLEGVAFALADGLDALEVRGGRIDPLVAIGGGARSPLWLEILAAALERRLIAVQDADIGPALGAARLAMVGRDAADPAVFCPPPAMLAEVLPDPALQAAMAARRSIYRGLYPALRPLFTAAHSVGG